MLKEKRFVEEQRLIFDNPYSVPTEWTECRLGKVATLQRGFDLPTTERRPGNVPVVSSSGQSGSHDIAMVKAPGIVTGRYGTVGIISYVEEDFWPLNTSLFVKDFHENYPKFIYYLLQRVNLKRLSDKTGVPGINRNDVHKIRVLLPPLTEQKRIVDVLEAWDSAIALTEKLITAKQKLKQRLMQELLTQNCSSDHKLLPNQKQWDKGYFLDVAEIVMGQSPPGLTYNQEGIGVPLINGPTEFGVRNPIEIQWTSSPTKKCKPNDILLCVRGSSTGRINIAQKEYCIGRGIAAIRAKKNKSISSYLEYQLVFGINKLLALTAGSTFPNIDKKSIGKIPILIPSLEEQKYIVDVLSEVDREMHLLSQENKFFRQQKSGLMQKLLTGEWRVLAEAEVAA